MEQQRRPCLLVTTASDKGVHLASFIQAWTLTSSAFKVTIATPNGDPIQFSRSEDGGVSESTARWVTEFRAKPISKPIKLENVDPSSYIALFLPSALGALYDLYDNAGLAAVLAHFVSMQKPICAVGHGVAGLCSSFADGSRKKWTFRGYSMTGPTVHEVSQLSEFGELSVITADFIRQHGGNYNPGRVDAMHVVVDQHLVSGQNVQSTLTAVQNLILLSNTWQAKPGTR